jgi:hypothetical protein
MVPGFEHWRLGFGIWLGHTVAWKIVLITLRVMGIRHAERDEYDK